MVTGMGPVMVSVVLSASGFHLLSLEGQLMRRTPLNSVRIPETKMAAIAHRHHGNLAGPQHRFKKANSYVETVCEYVCQRVVPV